MTIRGRAVLTSMLFAPALALAQPVGEQPVLGEDERLYSCKSRTGEVAVTFKPETEVKDLLTWVMGFTCKNFVLDPRIVATGRKVTIIAPNKMTAAEAYRVFLVALSTINYTLVPKGNIVTVVESSTAKNQTVPLYKHGVPDNNDQYVRYVYRPKYAQAESLVQAFTALKSGSGDVQLVGSILLVTDYASHVRDMLSFAQLIDVPKGSDGIYTITVNHADAKTVADQVTSIIGMQTAAAPAPRTPNERPSPVAAAVPSKIVVDVRTNTLIISATQAGYDRAKALVERIDIPLDIEGGTTFHVYKLGSAIAEELSRTLNDAIQGQGRPPQKPGGPPPPPMADALGTAIEGQVRVIADKPTNSLLVMSSGRDFLAIKDVIKMLDIPRRQVYIEALILEVQVGSSLDIGTSIHGGIPTNGGAIAVGGVQLPNLRSMAVGSAAAANGLIGALVGPQLANSKSIVGTSIPSYGVLFQALGGNASTNIISAPSFIGIDNKEAKQKVGVDIPYKRGFSLITSGDVPPAQNIDRKVLALELNITPHISSDETVLLEIKHESADLGERDAELGPTWSTRSLETSVVVRDQHTVVIGGLMQEREISSTSKVPLLGDIPILGYLFKYKTRSKRKSNLVIMLTPYIIKDHMDLEAIHARKRREHDEFVRSFGALDGAKYVAKVDYGRKRGFIEEINRTVISVEEDVAARGSFHKPPKVQQGAIEYGDGEATARP